MITILYIYKNKDLQRIKRSLDSLQNQTNREFEICVVDYGSDEFYKNALIKILSEYSDINHVYSYHRNQPWSRSKAINIGIRKIKTPFVFVADIDMIFRYDFISELHKLKNENTSVCFRVGFLDEKESQQNKKFEHYKIKHLSDKGAEGLSLFPVKALELVFGFDEFFHFWGAEDQDIHNRLESLGLQKIYYNKEILMLHQWHVSYRRSESEKLTYELQLSDISRLNQVHKNHNEINNISQINNSNWGTMISDKEFLELENYTVTKEISNLKCQIDHFLFCELPNLNKGIYKFRFLEDCHEKNIKYKIKKIIGKPVQKYYNMKQINDKILLHLISFFNNNHYSYQISENLKYIDLTIKI